MAAVAAAFGLPGAPLSLTPVAGAWSHRVFRLRTTAGEYAVKQMLNPWGEALWRDWLTEAWEFEQLAFAAGITMPRPVPAADGNCVADVDSGSGRTQVAVRVHHWVDGAPCPSGPVDLPTARAVGADLARMHALRHVPRRLDVFPRSDSAGTRAWPELVHRLEEREPSLAAPADAVSGVVRRIGELYDSAGIDNSAEPMSHGDVDQKNLILTPLGPVLCDWDVASPWRPSAELLRSAMSLSRWQRPAVARETIAAYRRAGGADVPVRPEDLALDLVIGLDWLVFCLERASGLRNADAQRREEGRRQAESMLADLPRRVDLALSVDRWLDG